jgi:hypothetical protein
MPAVSAYALLLACLPIRYCPELNPIELLWSKIKYAVRRYGKHSRNQAIASLRLAAIEITSADVAGYFGHCGY